MMKTCTLDLANYAKKVKWSLEFFCALFGIEHQAERLQFFSLASADPAKPLEIGTLYWNEALEVIVGALVKTNEAVGETCPAGIKTGEATAEAMASMLNSLES
jgi:hypothetical protein